MLAWYNNCVNSYRLIVIIFNSNLSFAVRAKIIKDTVFSYLCKFLCHFVCKRNRHWHKFGCFVTSVTEHHTLVAGTCWIFVVITALFTVFITVINALRNIRRLFVNSRNNGTSCTVKAVFSSVIAYVKNNLSCNLREINIARCCNFTHNWDYTRCTSSFASDSCHRIFF